MKSLILAASLIALPAAASPNQGWPDPQIPVDNSAVLELRSDPSGATMLVTPADKRLPSYRCPAPCSIRVRPADAFSVYPMLDGYVQDGPPTPLRRVWRGHVLVFDPPLAVFKMKPKP